MKQLLMLVLLILTITGFTYESMDEESSQEKLQKDYSYATTDNYEIYDKELSMKREIIDFEKQEFINKIYDENLKLSKIKPDGTYYTAGKYPFYDGAAFFDGVSAQHVMSGVPSMSSGGMLKDRNDKPIVKKETENPFEVGKYQRSYKGNGKYASSPAAAYF